MKKLFVLFFIFYTSISFSKGNRNDPGGNGNGRRYEEILQQLKELEDKIENIDKALNSLAAPDETEKDFDYLRWILLESKDHLIKEYQEKAKRKKAIEENIENEKLS